MVTINLVERKLLISETAFETVKLEITLGSDKYKPEDFLIEVAKRESVSRMIEF